MEVLCSIPPGRGPEDGVLMNLLVDDMEHIRNQKHLRQVFQLLRQRGLKVEIGRHSGNKAWIPMEAWRTKVKEASEQYWRRVHGDG